MSLVGRFLALEALPLVVGPTLLIVRGDDHAVIQMNRQGFVHLTAPKEMRVVPGAGHLCQEPGALENVSRLAREWFQRYLGTAD